MYKGGQLEKNRSFLVSDDGFNYLRVSDEEILKIEKILFHAFDQLGDRSLGDDEKVRILKIIRNNIKICLPKISLHNQIAEKIPMIMDLVGSESHKISQISLCILILCLNDNDDYADIVFNEDFIQKLKDCITCPSDLCSTNAQILIVNNIKSRELRFLSFFDFIFTENSIFVPSAMAAYIFYEFGYFPHISNFSYGILINFLDKIVNSSDIDGLWFSCLTFEYIFDLHINLLIDAFFGLKWHEKLKKFLFSNGLTRLLSKIIDIIILSMDKFEEYFVTHSALLSSDELSQLFIQYIDDSAFMNSLLSLIYSSIEFYPRYIDTLHMSNDSLSPMDYIYRTMSTDTYSVNFVSAKLTCIIIEKASGTQLRKLFITSIVPLLFKFIDINNSDFSERIIRCLIRLSSSVIITYGHNELITLFDSEDATSVLCKMMESNDPKTSDCSRILIDTVYKK